MARTRKQKQDLLQGINFKACCERNKLMKETVKKIRSNGGEVQFITNPNELEPTETALWRECSNFREDRPCKPAPACPPYQLLI